MKTLKYAVRFLMRSRSYTIINLLGLAFSLACCIILLRYIHRELTVDTHCVDRNHVIATLIDNNGNLYASHVDYLDTVYIAPEKIIEKSELVVAANTTLVYNNESYAMNVIAADSSFLRLFHYDLAEGKSTLSAPDEALITRECAQRLFGKENPIGKVLKYNVKTVTVRGVIEQPECKSVFDFDLLLHKDLQKEWGKTHISLLHVLPGVDLKKINEQCNVYKEYYDEKLDFGYRHRYEFVTWKDVYFKNLTIDDYKGILHFGNLDYLYILCVIAALLLFVGIMNFVNLYMVLMMKRSKEYSIKKIFGLQKLPLFVQIWLENFLIAASALLVAWWIIEMTQIPIGRLFGVRMEYSHFDWQLSAAFLTVLPILTSIYPYIRYQYMSPISSMRHLYSTRHSIVIRMSFLAVQYVVTTVLMIFSLYLNSHFQFLINAPKGYQAERILEADLIHENESLDTSRSKEEREKEWKKRRARIERINQLLDECTAIESWQIQENDVVEGGELTLFRDDTDKEISLHYQSVGRLYFDLYGLKMVEGSLPEGIDKKDYGDFTLVINEAAMRAFGFRQLEDAFIRAKSPLAIAVVKGNIHTFGTSLMPVAAVVNDYYSGHLTEGVRPTVFNVSENSRRSRGQYYIKVKEGREKEMTDYLRSIMQEVYHTDDFQYTWMTDKVKALYDDDRRVATIYTVFALIAIAISCLGLFGISLFDIRQRYREIGIRKINGAGMKDLYKLLFRKYVVVLGAAFVVAVPIAYYLITIYTRDFAVKAPVGIGLFVIALLVVAVISLGTLFWQVRRAANINPADVMKTE